MTKKVHCVPHFKTYTQQSTLQSEHRSVFALVPLYPITLHYKRVFQMVLFLLSIPIPSSVAIDRHLAVTVHDRPQFPPKDFS